MRLVGAVALVLLGISGYQTGAAFGTLAGQLTGNVTVEGQTGLGTVKTKLFALPSTVKQPVQVAEIVPYLILDATGRFERALEEGTYLVGFTNPKLEFAQSDGKIELDRGSDTLSLPVKSVAIGNNLSTTQDLRITTASAARPDPDPRVLTLPLGGGGGFPEATSNSSNTVWMVLGGLLVGGGLLVFLMRFFLARRRVPPYA